MRLQTLTANHSNSVIEQQGNACRSKKPTSWLTSSAAFARTYRHGQGEETHLWRTIVQNTIDAELDEMQMRKEDEILAVMDPKKAPHPNHRR